MQWCALLNMWCFLADAEDYVAIGCDGECRGCVYCEDIKNEESL